MLRTRSYSSKETTEDLWADFDHSENDKVLKLDTFIKDDDEFESDDSTDYESKSRKASLRCMVLGSIGSGRHELVNSMFESEDSGKLDQTMDLVMKFEEEEENENVY